MQDYLLIVAPVWTSSIYRESDAAALYSFSLSGSLTFLSVHLASTIMLIPHATPLRSSSRRSRTSQAVTQHLPRALYVELLIPTSVVSATSTVDFSLNMMLENGELKNKLFHL